jgi:hypothetical protein
MKKQWTKKQILIAALALMLTFTPFYMIAYLAIAYYGAKHLQASKIFSSLFSRFILFVLLLAGAVMAVGMVLWCIHIAVHPLIVAITFGGLTYVLTRLYPAKAASAKFDRSDAISLASASIIVGFIALSFYLPKPQDSATLQIVTNGYDNMAHVTLLMTDTKENGYVYGFKDDVGHKTISSLGAYPQGWHLATSHLLNGFGVNLLEPTKPLQAMTAYLGTLLVWYLITVYIAGRLAWRLLEEKISKATTKKADTIIVFLIASALIQFLVYWGSLLFGFASYFGCLAYIVLLAGLVIDKDDENYKAYLLIACVATLAAAQSWILPLPTMLATIALGFLWHKKPTHLAQLLRFFRRPNRHVVMTAGFLAIALIGGLFQVGILLYFNSVGATSAQLVNDGGIFWTSSMLVSILVTGTLIYWLKNKLTHSADWLIANLLPVLLLTAAIFAYQMLTTDGTSYYFIKTLGLAVAVTGLFFVPAFTDWILQLKKDISYPLAGSAVAILVLTLLFIGTGQNLMNFDGFLQRNSKITTETAEVIIDYLRTKDNTKNQLIVFRDASFEEDAMGSYVANRLSHRPEACAGIVSTREQHTEEKLEKLQRCMNNTPRDHFTIVTSDKTDLIVRERFGDSLSYVKVP